MDLRTAKYLDPKNDLTFRKIFGEHEDIIKSFLNAMLPFDESQYIEELHYATPALLPILPELKHSIVDVHCRDNTGRRFIVEMQMYWSSSFRQRMLFNAGKAYVKQIDKGHEYSELMPVYALSLVNENFMTEPQYEDIFYHRYRLAHIDNPEEVISGIELIFVELQKFKAKNFTDRKLQYLWLRFLTEINEETKEVPDDLLSQEAIRKALEQLQVNSFSKEELEYYEQYWDKVRTERTVIQDAYKKAEAKVKELLEQERREKELAKQKAEQERKEKELAKQRLFESAKLMKNVGLSTEQIMQATGLSKDEIEKL